MGARAAYTLEQREAYEAHVLAELSHQPLSKRLLIERLPPKLRRSLSDRHALERALQRLRSRELIRHDDGRWLLVAESRS